MLSFIFKSSFFFFLIISISSLLISAIPLDSEEEFKSSLRLNKAAELMDQDEKRSHLRSSEDDDELELEKFRLQRILIQMIKNYLLRKQKVALNSSSEENSSDVSSNEYEEFMDKIVKKSWDSRLWKLPADTIRLFAQNMRKSSAPQKLYDQLLRELTS
jgi:hypothetical protein